MLLAAWLEGLMVGASWVGQIVLVLLGGLLYPVSLALNTWVPLVADTMEATGGQTDPDPDAKEEDRGIGGAPKRLLLYMTGTCEYEAAVNTFKEEGITITLPTFSTQHCNSTNLCVASRDY